jgi:hypothetical protein
MRIKGGSMRRKGILGCAEQKASLRSVIADRHHEF